MLTLHHMFRGFGANIVHVPVDENGMQMIQRGRFVAEKNNLTVLRKLLNAELFWVEHFLPKSFSDCTAGILFKFD